MKQNAKNELPPLMILVILLIQKYELLHTGAPKDVCLGTPWLKCCARPWTCKWVLQITDKISCRNINILSVILFPLVICLAPYFLPGQGPHLLLDR